MATLIDISTATLFGNMSQSNGLGVLVDGSNAVWGYAYPDPGYCGVVLPYPTRIDSAQLDSSAVYGFDGSGYDYVVTLSLYGRTSGLPSTPTDGTHLGSVIFTDANILQTKTVESLDKDTVFSSVWWRVVSTVKGSMATEMRFYSAENPIIAVRSSIIRQYASELSIVVPFSVWSTKPTEYDITDCYPGEDWKKGFRLKDRYRTARPLSGYTAKMQIRDKVGGIVYKELTTENGRIVILGTLIILKLSDDDTLDLTFKEGAYDLFITGGGITNFVVGGKWIPRKAK